ncbi:hypothetical protein BOW53_15445 [Solemya pervernicosa gill symbiont]|uniref:L,D-TPase catalytic domain-containing protein n=1 Tax=Solemya pervernicosa gill symbiont TaxID=642797 RepID=A0A1T2L086_9GAMM|nr:L,D-transpeptidase family protein [Solemya pervernicosa gill symbiont]OOZ38474.1 hypothetical protein BOW53_15445 [Solemya pervernicosa gill symbiont]
MKTKLISFAILSAFLAGSLTTYIHGRSFWAPIYQKIVGKRSTADVITIYGDHARNRMRPFFEQANISYPPQSITFLAIKETEQLEIWAETNEGPRFIRSYQIEAMSGEPGPKLKEGDRQVPEGVYLIEYLNPNSAYHLSMKLDYPNPFDLKHATAEGRTQPGSNIFIHGKAVSIGCLAMGDQTIEELFVLTSDIGKANIQIAIAPNDPRVSPLPTSVSLGWISELHSTLNSYFSRYTKTLN